MLKTIYHFDLHTPIINNLATLGKYDGKNESLCYASVGGKVVIYSPHEKYSKDKVISEGNSNNVLTLNRDVTAIDFSYPKNGKELLLIGSPTNLLTYDIQNNVNVFNKEISDGVFSICSGLFGSIKEPNIIIGGNCSLQGFDYSGEEKFWTVAGGNAKCLELNDLDKDGFNEMIVGTDDFAIRFYKNENVLHEINETTEIVNLTSLSENKFIYALENGTIGIYNNRERSWRKKEKGFICSAFKYDINNDGINEIICGWSTGKLQVREESNGSVIFEQETKHEMASLLLGDLNNQEKKQLICCQTNGEILGLTYGDEVKIFEQQMIAKDPKLEKADIDELNSLLNLKKSIMAEIEEVTVKDANRKKVNQSKDQNNLPKDTTVKIDLQSNNTFKCADLIIEATENAIIKCVFVMSEQLYKGETYIQYPEEETSVVTVQIKNEKDMNINLHIKVLVGMTFYGKDYQVYEFNKIIPKYCFYILLRDELLEQYNEEPEQGVEIQVNERLERLLIWLEQNFNIAKADLEKFKKQDSYDIRFLSLRADKLKIMSDEIELAGNVLQDICLSFKIQDIETHTSYQKYVEDVQAMTINIEKLDSVRNQFSINMVDIINFIKDYFVKAEDNRMLDDIKTFREYFLKINAKNIELLDEYEKRKSTLDNLLSDLRKVNVGKYRNKLISLCRQAIKEKNYKLLLKYLSSGTE